MTTPAGLKKEFICIIPDKPDTLQKRLDTRPLHFEALKSLIASGKIVSGGALVQNHSPPGHPMLFAGSMATFTVDTIEEVWDILRADPYAVNGVWDLDNVQIYPFVPALRTALDK